MQYRKHDRLYMPQRIHTLVISTMHQKGFPIETQRKELMEKVVKVSLDLLMHNLYIYVHILLYIRLLFLLTYLTMKLFIIFNLVENLYRVVQRYKSKWE